MSTYRRITLAVRCQIDCYLQEGISVPEISRRLGFNKTSIYRELKRNLSFGIYSPSYAQLQSERRYSSCRKPYKISPEIAGKLRALLEFGLSPEQISGRLKLETGFLISHECIYQYIKKQDRSLLFFLRRPRKRGFSRYKYNQKKLPPKNGEHIDKRPSITNERKRLGDWERDLFYYGSGKHALVCTDRKSRYTKIAAVSSQNSDLVAN